MSALASEVTEGLWVSAMPAPGWDLVGWGVDLVVSVAEHPSPLAARRFEWATAGGAAGEGHIVWVHYPFDDGDVPSWAQVSLVAAFVATAVRAGRRVLVHCHEGQNRSALVAALALVQLTGCSGVDAVARLRAARPGALSNQAFADAVAQLPAAPR